LFHTYLGGVHRRDQFRNRDAEVIGKIVAVVRKVIGAFLNGTVLNLISGGKAPRLTIGGKAPNMLIGAKPPKVPMANIDKIARTPVQIGNYIRERRRELGLTQEKLAAKIGVRQRTVSDIETSAAARLDTVLRALAALDLELVIRLRTKSSPQDIERLF
jgi:HTH-type transcriptional regulator / antitoxin HipB